ncbi:MAG TPA: dynamin family protein, partial [Candidatus Acidoferrales bacterium]|nr:dynamin family protein [Candidatus Acidoferrales bacterium]
SPSMTAETTQGDEQRLATRAYGVLATALSDALSEARQALGPHQQHLPDDTLTHLDDLIAEFQRKRVRIALFGEVKAGKSTLINAIAGAPLSPMAFDPLTSVPVRITWGAATAWRVGGRRLESIDELEQLMRHGSVEASEVVVETALDVLQLGGQVDLLDTPGVGSDAHFDSITDEALQSLDAVILVVRYPALFTQVTRRLMQRLDADISKLFVVWNLDAASNELEPSERERHAADLKAHVAGAHELHLVDARAALRGATQSGTRLASGLAAFVDAITRFVSSDRREVSALREAAKRSQQWLKAAQAPLHERQTIVERDLAAAQSRLDAVAAAAKKESDAIGARQSEIESALAAIAQQAGAAATQRATAMRSALNAARRTWIRRGELRALETSVRQAIRGYADDVEKGVRAVRDSLMSQAAALGAQPSLPTWVRSEPAVGRLTTEDRNVRAGSGSLRILRRALWRKWYLPGLVALEEEAIDRDLAAQTAWRDMGVQATLAAIRQVRDAQLAQITARATAEAEQIKLETGYAGLDDEARVLREDVPAITAQIGAIESLTREAWRLTEHD